MPQIATFLLEKAVKVLIGQVRCKPCVIGQFEDEAIGSDFGGELKLGLSHIAQKMCGCMR